MIVYTLLIDTVVDDILAINLQPFVTLVSRKSWHTLARMHYHLMRIDFYLLTYLFNRGLMH